MNIPPGPGFNIPPTAELPSIYQLLPDWQQEVWRKLQGIEARAEAVEFLLRVPRASLSGLSARLGA